MKVPSATSSVATRLLNATLTPLVADLDQVPLRVLLEALLLEVLGGQSIKFRLLRLHVDDVGVVRVRAVEQLLVAVDFFVVFTCVRRRSRCDAIDATKTLKSSPMCALHVIRLMRASASSDFLPRACGGITCHGVELPRHRRDVVSVAATARWR